MPTIAAFLADVLEAVRLDWRMRIIPADQGLLDRAIDLYQRRQDKDWSLISRRC